MNSSDRVSELLPQLLGLPKSEREAHLNAVCDDPAVRREIRELLSDRSRMRAFLEQTDDGAKTLILLQSHFGDADADDPTVVLNTPAGQTPPTPAIAMRPDFIGPYHILKVLGQGGMGVVYLAEQTEPVRRQLAVKLIHRSLRDPVSAARFEGERQAMARLSHPSIAQIFEAGTTEDGFPYFAMEFVPDGIPITKYCDIHRLTVEKRLKLFIRIARGVQHAHQRGILHRDLKPSNILVAEQQDEETAKIIDFGLAKALDRPLTDEGELTQGFIVGTPEYMSPEAFRIGDETLDLDTRSDVYSLGIILYEMLCSVRPFESKDRELMALVQELTTTDPPALTRRLSSIAEQSQEAAERRGTQVAALRKRLSGDLDYVVRKAIATDREDRYDSVADLIADIDRHLQQKPVEAHPPSAAYRFKKFLRRHRAVAASAFLALLAMIFGTIGITVGMVQANREARVAKRALAESEASAAFLTDLFRSSEPGNPAQNLTAREILDIGARNIGEQFIDQPAAKARILQTIGDIYTYLALLDQAEELLTESLTLREKALGRRHPETAQILMSLGILKASQDDYVEAENLFEEALEIFQEAEDLKNVAAVKLALTRLLRTKDLDRAESLAVDALELRLQIYGSDHLQVSDALDVLASVRNFQDRADEAEVHILRSLEIREEMSPDHPSVARTLQSLASIYRDQGRHEEALPLTERAVEIYEKAFDEGHPRIATAVSEAASAHEALGRLEQAETLYLRAISILEEFAPISGDLSVTLNNLGTLYWGLQRYEDAEPLYRRSLQIKEEIMEPGRSSFGHSYNNLGLIYWKQRRFEKAESYLRRALENWEENFGPDHSLVAWPLWGLAGTYRDQKRYEDAELLYVRALQIRERVLPPDSPYLLETRDDYAALLRATGREAKAEEILKGNRDPAPPENTTR